MRRLITAAALSLACAGCLPEGTLQFDALQLGRSLNPDHTVANHTTTFTPKDTIYASVLTSNIGAGTIAVRWTFEGKVVGEPSKQVRYKGPGVTEFMLTGGGDFPAGNYKVEVFIDGQAVTDRAFRVEQ